MSDCEALDLQLARLLTDDHTRGLIDALKGEQLEGKISLMFYQKMFLKKQKYNINLGEFYIGLSRNETMPEFFQWVDGQSIHGDGVYSGLSHHAI